jgi:hypothetical protein
MTGGCPVQAYRRRQRLEARDLALLLGRDGYGAGLREIYLTDLPVWLPSNCLQLVVRHAPLTAFGVASEDYNWKLDLTKLPRTLRRLTVKAYATPSRGPNHAPLPTVDVPILEHYVSNSWSYQPPTRSQTLECLRIRGGWKQHDEVGIWAYPRLRILDIQSGCLGEPSFVDGASASFFITPESFLSRPVQSPIPLPHARTHARTHTHT